MLLRILLLLLPVQKSILSMILHEASFHLKAVTNRLSYLRKKLCNINMTGASMLNVKCANNIRLLHSLTVNGKENHLKKTMSFIGLITRIYMKTRKATNIMSINHCNYHVAQKKDLRLRQFRRHFKQSKLFYLHNSTRKAFD